MQRACRERMNWHGTMSKAKLTWKKRRDIHSLESTLLVWKTKGRNRFFTDLCVPKKISARRKTKTEL